MNKKITIPDEVIINKIYVIRGQKVMLDRDLAELYDVQTRRLKEQVRRNISRFPEEFMFELTKEENQDTYEILYRAIADFDCIVVNFLKSFRGHKYYS